MDEIIQVILVKKKMGIWRNR